MLRRVLFPLALGIVGSVAVASAQTATPTAPPDDASLERLRGAARSAKFVRVTTPAGAFVERRVDVQPHGLLCTAREGWDTVKLNAQPTTLVSWDRLAQLEIKRGTSDRWMWGGAILGGVIGALIGDVQKDEQSRGGQAATVLYGVVGGGIGMGVGSVFGSSFDPWVRVWP